MKRVIIMGAAGRDFHNFNVYFKSNSDYQVVGFTATQIPNIEGRCYPSELAGDHYPEGIPIWAEEKLSELLKIHEVDLVVFAYSDVSHNTVMHKASIVLSTGADFMLLGADSTMLKSNLPVISITAVRTGCGKSQTTRKVCEILERKGRRLAVIRHPMPYGDLTRQIVQRFASYEDLEKHECSIEEREEYEPHLDRHRIVYAGVDYAKILEQAEKEADLIIWDGGNNDLSFYKPDLSIVVVDPLRAGHELLYHPGEVNLLMADVVVINKLVSALPSDIKIVRKNVHQLAPQAMVIDADSPVIVDNAEMLRGKRVLVIEDGPTLTHGEMTYGAGVVAAEKFGVAEIVDPKPYAVGTIAEALAKYPQVGPVLPALGYGKEQINDLEKTINAVNCDAVLAATPIDLSRLLKVRKPIFRVRYELSEIGLPTLKEALDHF